MYFPVADFARRALVLTVAAKHNTITATASRDCVHRRLIVNQSKRTHLLKHFAPTVAGYGNNPGFTDDAVAPLEELCLRAGYIAKGRPISGKELAEWLDVHPVTVEGWRQAGTGPPYFSPAGQRRVWYGERGVLLWFLSGARSSTSE